MAIKIAFLSLVVLLGFAVACTDLETASIASDLALGSAQQPAPAPAPPPRPSCNDANAILECDGTFSHPDCAGKDALDACTAWGGGPAGTCGPNFCWLVGQMGNQAVCKCDCECFADPAADEHEGSAAP